MGGEREHTRLTLEGVDDVGRRRWGATAGAHRVHHARRYTWRRGAATGTGMRDEVGAAGADRGACTTGREQGCAWTDGARTSCDGLRRGWACCARRTGPRTLSSATPRSSLPCTDRARSGAGAPSTTAPSSTASSAWPPSARASGASGPRATSTSADQHGEPAGRLLIPTHCMLHDRRGPQAIPRHWRCAQAVVRSGPADAALCALADRHLHPSPASRRRYESVRGGRRVCERGGRGAGDGRGGNAAEGGSEGQRDGPAPHPSPESGLRARRCP